MLELLKNKNLAYLCIYVCYSQTRLPNRVSEDQKLV